MHLSHPGGAERGGAAAAPRVRGPRPASSSAGEELLLWAFALAAIVQDEFEFMGGIALTIEQRNARPIVFICLYFRFHIVAVAKQR